MAIFLHPSWEGKTYRGSSKNWNMYKKVTLLSNLRNLAFFFMA